ncbi:hypothetical protein EK904_002522 [Melospiza melodia maxima]|nr:hypothetical protein EK904_002522 [Melospiza melodia maxima]
MESLLKPPVHTFSSHEVPLGDSSLQNSLFLRKETSGACALQEDSSVIRQKIKRKMKMMKGSEKQLTNGVSGGFLAFLVHAVVTSDCPVSSFCFYSLAIRADQHAAAGYYSEIANPVPEAAVSETKGQEYLTQNEGSYCTKDLFIQTKSFREPFDAAAMQRTQR